MYIWRDGQVVAVRVEELRKNPEVPAKWLQKADPSLRPE
jgi:hypothetical protein